MFLLESVDVLLFGAVAWALLSGRYSVLRRPPLGVAHPPAGVSVSCWDEQLKASPGTALS